MGANVTAVEYYHVPSEHYFVTADPAEMAVLDGKTEWAWYRTGLRYRVSDAPGQGLAPVCRYYTGAFASQPTHFFSASAAECGAVAANRDWTYEGIAFYVPTPDAQGQCGVGNVPVYRLYNNGRNDAPNHAYTPHAAQRTALREAGFTEEGVAFCVPTGTAEEAQARTALLAGSRWALPASPLYYDGGDISTTFASSVTADGAQYLRSKGGPEVPYIIYHHVNSIWAGAAGWDPLSDAYVVVGGGGLDGDAIVGAGWLLDSAEGPTGHACAVMILRNPANYYGHPFQQIVWTGCTDVTAQKL
ncbi:MAG TPA: hypothetical protein VLU54_17035 [Casimicrobiaceae bacterium]|nr:hypothetical protein [Casimicrobiaceae bacterium]